MDGRVAGNSDNKSASVGWVGKMKNIYLTKHCSEHNNFIEVGISIKFYVSCLNLWETREDVTNQLFSDKNQQGKLD